MEERRIGIRLQHLLKYLDDWNLKKGESYSKKDVLKSLIKAHPRCQSDLEDANKSFDNDLVNRVYGSEENKAFLRKIIEEDREWYPYSECHFYNLYSIKKNEAFKILRNNEIVKKIDGKRLYTIMINQSK